MIILGLTVVVFGVMLGGGFFGDELFVVPPTTGTTPPTTGTTPPTTGTTPPTTGTTPPTTGTTPPTTGTVPKNDKSNFNPNLIEEYIFEITNSERMSRNLQPLDRDKIIDGIAYKHSLDMATRDYFSHINPEGLGSVDRGNKAGLNTNSIGCHHNGLGENIVWSHTYTSYYTVGPITTYAWLADEREMAEKLMGIWMTSKGHRENILLDSYSNIGIGAYIYNKKIFATQNFC